MGLGSGSLSRAQDQEKHKEKETELGKIMEKVQKENIAITKATRNAASYKKGQKDVEKSATRAGQAGQGGEEAQGRRQERQERGQPREEVG